MRLSQTELNVLKELALGRNVISDLARTLHKSEQQVYRSSKKLGEKGFVNLVDRRLKPQRTPHATLLLALLKKYPNLVSVLSGSGLPILSSIASPKTVTDIIRDTDISKTVVYGKINQSLSLSILKSGNNDTYSINKEIWPDLASFLKTLTLYDEISDPRVPEASTIYHRTRRDIVFSTSVQVDATPTAFSEYKNYGLSLLLPVNFFYLPKRHLTREDVFLHSLFVIEKEHERRYALYTVLFYLKYRKGLQNTKHPFMTKIQKVLEKKTIDDFPTYNEIMEKARDYDIRF
jgi:hypothetical protein